MNRRQANWKSHTAILWMLAAILLSIFAVPLHELLEHSDEAVHCASEADSCHAAAPALPGITSHPVDDCFDQDHHQACTLCVALSQGGRHLPATPAAAPFALPAQQQISAIHAVSFPAPVTGADPTRGPPTIA